MNILSKQAGAAVVRVRRMQREQILKTLQPGDFFGEIALVSRCPRTATVKARSFVECALVMRCDFEGMLVDHPQKLNQALAMVRSFYDGVDDQNKAQAAYFTNVDAHSHHINKNNCEVKYIQSKESIIISTTTNRVLLAEHQKSSIGISGRIQGRCKSDNPEDIDDRIMQLETATQNLDGRLLRQFNNNIRDSLGRALQIRHLKCVPRTTRCLRQSMGATSSSIISTTSER